MINHTAGCSTGVYDEKIQITIGYNMGPLTSNRKRQHETPSVCTCRDFNSHLCLQASVSPSSYTLSKCFLPEESTVIGVYCTAGACLLLLFLAHCLWMKGLLQCLNLFLLGKHKSLWTALPRVHQNWAIEESVKTDDDFFFCQCDAPPLDESRKIVYTALIHLSECLTRLWPTWTYINIYIDTYILNVL